MSVRPLLVFRGYEGDLAVLPLQIDLSRVEAETEAAYLIDTDEMASRFAAVAHTVSILLVDEESVPTAVEALFAGLAVHSVDCDCDAADAEATVEAVMLSNAEADALADLEMYLASFTDGIGCGHEGHEGRDCGV